MRREQAISVIMPVHNGKSTLEKTLESLLAQSNIFDELIIVDDASNDGSAKAAAAYLDGRRDYQFMQNEKCLGLAATYNRGVKAAACDLVVTLHQDIVLENDSLRKLVAPFCDDQVVAASHIVAHPLDVWNRYNFWQKCFFARLAGKDFSGIDGKFDCFRKSALEKVGLFDEIHFRTAGEDGDIVYKLEKIGKISETGAKIVHIHKNDPCFSWKDIIRKQMQYSEAQGALLSRGRINGINPFFKTFFREIMLAALLVPFAAYLSLALILAYSFWYTKLVFLKEYRNPRILVLPFLNIFLLLVSFAYSLRGLILRKQETSL